MTQRLMPLTVTIFRQEPIALQIPLPENAEYLGELSIAQISDWEDKLTAGIADVLRPRIRPMGPSREIIRDAADRIVRAIDAPSDPPAAVMAQRAAREAARAVVDRLVAGDVAIAEEGE